MCVMRSPAPPLADSTTAPPTSILVDRRTGSTGLVGINSFGRLLVMLDIAALPQLRQRGPEVMQLRSRRTRSLRLGMPHSDDSGYHRRNPCGRCRNGYLNPRRAGILLGPTVTVHR